MKNPPDTSRRIRLASLAMIGLFIALGAVAYFSGQQVKRDSDLVAKDAVPGTIAAHRMRMAMSRSVGWVMVAASAQNTESRDASLKTVHEADVDFAHTVEQYKETITINPTKDQSLLTEVTRQYANFQQKRLAYEALILAGDRDKAAAFLENELVPAYTPAINSAAELLDYNHANSITYSDHIRNSVHRLYWAVAVVMVLALICAAVLIWNLSIRRRELLELRVSEQKYRGVVEQSPLGIFQSSVEGRLLAANSTLAAMFGYDTPEQMIRDNDDIAVQRFAQPEQRRETVRAASESQVSIQREIQQRRRNGAIFPANLYMRAVRAADGTIQYLEGFIEDISVRKRAEEELLSKTALLEAQVDSTIDGILVVDGSSRKILQNRRLLEIFKVPDEIARDDDDTTLLRYVTQRTKNPQQFGERVNYLYAHPDETDRNEIELQDGTILDRYSAPVLDKAGNHYGRIWTFRDITAQRKVEEQFRQAQKMEAIGTLAGGIAHDFNNILAAIIGYTEMAKRRAANEPTVMKYLDAVFQGGNRAVALVRQILTFSRPQEAQERKPVELGQIVAEPLKLLRASIPSNIEFDISLDSNLPPVLADATQVHQIVMNLCTNASHAMKDRTGRLGVKLEKFTVDKFMAGANTSLRAGPYVRLSASDTGHGMSKATIARIFEPFFTTKGPGEGTGLGLSVVHGIMQSHGGAITVYSQPGEGTIFHLYFPITTESSKETATVKEEAPGGNGERILFVDDEMPLASLGQSMLEELGYVVDYKTNVADALALVRANPAAFDLVITDLTMPLMLGTDFAQELLLIRPNLPIILTTGYTANLTPERVRELGIREILAKPHTMQLLGTAVHRVLKAQP